MCSTRPIDQAGRPAAPVFPALAFAMCVLAAGCAAHSKPQLVALPDASAGPAATTPATPMTPAPPPPPVREFTALPTTGAPGKARATAFGATGGAQTQVATNVPEVGALPEKLVVEGSIEVEVEEVAGAAAALRAKIEAAGGRVVSEQLSGSAQSWRGHMQVKLPPEGVAGFLDWLGQAGQIRSKQIRGTDVSRTLYDQEIALENLTLTLERLRALLAREGLEMKDILAIETEMTRLRGEIERIKGEKRWLEHRVALATLDIGLSRREGVILGPEAKFFPGARLSMMTLIDPEGRPRTRLGAGVAIRAPVPVTLELDVFERADSDSRALLATVGRVVYSDFLGRGRRRLLNPYLGFRLGYGYLDGSAFAFGAGGGVELFKSRFALVEANVFTYGLARSEFDVAVVGGLGAVVAF